MSDSKPARPDTPEDGRATDQPGERRRLERAPGERYAAGGPGSGGGTPAGRPGGVPVARPGGMPPRTRAVLAGAVVADLGALLFFVLGLVDLGIGLLAIAAFVGWTTALALTWWGRGAIPDARLRVGLAAGLGAWAMVLAMLVDVGFALAQGGVLGPLDYLAQVRGPVAPLAVLIGAAVAAVRAR